MLQATAGLLISVASGVLAAALVPPTTEASGWWDIECPGCHVSDNPSANPGPGIVLDFDSVTMTAGTCVENTETEDPNDCKPSAKCKLGGALVITNNNPDPPAWQVNSSTGESTELPGNGASTPLALEEEFPCGGNVTFTVTRSDGTPGNAAEWSWSCAACPLDADG